jgi:hypothetical protein
MADEFNKLARLLFGVPEELTQLFGVTISAAIDENDNLHFRVRGFDLHMLGIPKLGWESPDFAQVEDAVRWAGDKAAELQATYTNTPMFRHGEDGGPSIPHHRPRDT